MKNLTKGNRTKIQICSLINLQQNSPLFRHIGQKLIQKQNVTIKIKKELLQYRYAFYHFWLHDFLLRESPLSTACMKPMDYELWFSYILPTLYRQNIYFFHYKKYSHNNLVQIVGSSKV